METLTPKFKMFFIFFIIIFIPNITWATEYLWEDGNYYEHLWGNYYGDYGQNPTRYESYWKPDTLTIGNYLQDPENGDWQILAEWNEPYKLTQGFSQFYEEEYCVGVIRYKTKAETDGEIHGGWAYGYYSTPYPSDVNQYWNCSEIGD